MTATLIRGLLAAAVSCTLAPLVLVLLRRWNVLDVPSERSSHLRPVPRGGGLAPAAGALAALAVPSSMSGGDRWAVAVAASAFGLVGLFEDVVGIRALHRLALQFAAAALAGVLVLDNLTGPGLWRAGFAAGAVFWLVAFVNGYNFMDGVNGISVAQAAVAGAAWFLIGAHAHRPVLAVGGAIVAGAALGFAPYNLVHPRMFLGDVGSYFLGAWLATVAVLGLRTGVPAEAVLAPLGLYVADTGTTLLSRIARDECWYLPHREHAYQRLGDAGWSHVQVSAFVAACLGACGALGAVSLGAAVPARIAADIAIVGVIAAYLLAPRLLLRKGSTMAVA